MTLIAVIPPLGLISAAAQLWGVALSWVDVASFRPLRRRGLGNDGRLPPPVHAQELRDDEAVRATFAILGSMTMQGPVTQWVTDHRKHHALSDQEGDPHSPHAGFAPGVFSG